MVLTYNLKSKLSFCEACVQGKCHRQPHYPLETIRSNEKLELVHTMFVGQCKHNPLVEVIILSHLLTTTRIIVTLIFRI